MELANLCLGDYLDENILFFQVADNLNTHVYRIYNLIMVDAIFGNRGDTFKLLYVLCEKDPESDLNTALGSVNIWPADDTEEARKMSDD